MTLYRSAALQADFLHDVYEQVTGREPASFVEIGCGPAQHSLEMAESDLTVFCVDNNAGMLEYAQQLAKEDDLKITVIGEDMRTFSLPVRAGSDGLQPVAAVIVVAALVVAVFLQIVFCDASAGIQTAALTVLRLGVQPDDQCAL